MSLSDVRIRSYEDLVAVLRARRVELGLRQLELDEIAGLQGGYTGKIECGSKGFGPMSLTALLGALGLELVAVKSAALLARGSAVAQAQDAHSLKLFMAKKGAKGGRRAWGQFLPEERSAMLKKRWAKGRRNAALSRSGGGGGNGNS